MSEWISVEDRLPVRDIGPESENVLTYCVDKGCVQGFYCHDDEEWYDIYGRPLALWSTDDITHWQPLPEPPAN